MLRKQTELEIPPDDPFKHDKLDRKPAVTSIVQLISTLEQPFVIAVEGRWGSGKSTFLRMMREELLKQGDVCVSFNAWEVDFVADPLIAFVGEMNPELAAGIHANDRPIDKAWQKVKHAGGKLLKKGLPVAIKMLSHGILDTEQLKPLKDLGAADDIEIGLSKFAESRMDAYFGDRKSIQAFRDVLKKYVAVANSSNMNRRLVFLIDELDRCRPDFAVTLLERIKHFFSVEGIVFVLGIDRQQLVSAARGIYGQGLDGDGYLRKFVDFRFHLSEPTIAPFADQLWEYFQLNSWLTQFNTYSKSAILSSFVTCAEAFGMSLRAVEQCFTEFNLYLRTTPPHIDPNPFFAAFLIVLRSVNHDTYKGYCEGRIFFANVEEFIREQKQSSRFFNDRRSKIVLALLHTLSPRKEDRDYIQNHYNNLRTLGQMSADDSERFSNYKYALDMGASAASSTLFARLDLTAQLTSPI